jgi:hypothetical protein
MKGSQGQQRFDKCVRRLKATTNGEPSYIKNRILASYMTTQCHMNIICQRPCFSSLECILYVTVVFSVMRD